MGRHRSASAKRGISNWPVIALVALLVIAALVFGWLQLRKHSDNQSSSTAASCFDGDQMLVVAADPGIADAAQTIAARYNDTHPVVRDHCISVNVQPVSSDQILSDLGDKTDDQLPAVWIAQSGVELSQARTAHPDALSSASRSLATSPVVLAASAQHAATLGEIAWQDLPARQGDGALGLVLPAGEDSGASTLALAAVVNAAAGSSDAPLTAEQASSPQSRAATSALRSGSPADGYASTAEALAATETAPDQVLTVPVTEQQLYQQTKDQSSPTLRALSPAGATPVADYPATVLRGAEADETLSRAASAFSEFAQQQDQRDVLAQAGFQVPDGPSPTPANDAVSFTTPQSVLPTPEAGAIAVLAPRRGAGVQPPAATILLDVSGSMRELDGGQSRLLNVTEALRGELAGLPDDAALGLWRYSANLRGTSPYAIDVTTGLLGENVGDEGMRRALLDNALNLAAPVSATHTYTSLEAAYQAAVQGYVPGHVNSVLLITDGPNDDQSNLDAATMLRALADMQDPSRPVEVNVVVISPNSDLATLQSVADQTGGTLTYFDSSADPQFAAALRADLE